MKGFSLRLSHKITAIGVIGLVGLLTFGALDQYRTWQRDQSRAIEEKARKILEISRQTFTDMLEARRAEKDFQLRRDQSYVKQQEEFSTTVDLDLGELRSLVQASRFDDLVGRIDRVQSGFKSYANAFDALQRAEVELGLNENQGLSRSLSDAAEHILAKLNESANSSLSAAMLMVRHHKKPPRRYLWAFFRQFGTEFDRTAEVVCFPCFELMR